MFGGKKSRSADQLALKTCLQYQKAIQDGKFAAGLSYDLKKCFDTIPFMLALDVFAARGTDLTVVSTMRSFYNNHTKHFRLDGNHTFAFKPSCGIIQGCPISMLLLTALITCWAEKNQDSAASNTKRSYADDLSIVAEGATKKEVKDQLNISHQQIEKFTRLAGMTINMNKTFTFGATSFKACVPSISNHQTSFRLVGCSIKTTPAPMWTALEKQRFADWKQTIQRVRVLPLSWQDKSKVIQTAMSKLTFGQGMHALHASKETCRAMRAVVIRTLLDADNYNSSPNAIFALLTQPSNDPVFALDLAAFQLFRHTFQTQTQIDELKTAMNEHSQEQDGPITRLAQLKDHPVFAKIVAAFLNRTLHPTKWQHLLREDYRLHAWQTLCRDRAQHFAGTWQGVDRSRTLALLHELIVQADALQSKCDNDDFVIDDPKMDPRAKLKVLRLLLTGGLNNPELQHRHKKQDGTVVCLCKQGEPSLEHISWFCPRFANLRQQALDNLPAPLDQLPKCFYACALVPKQMNISAGQVRSIQQSLINIWQSHISDWYDNPDNFQVVQSKQSPPDDHIDPAQNSQATTEEIKSEPLSRNGHVIKINPEGGVFCCKYGKATKLLKHQRLKILSKPCKHPNLPQAHWLTSPGAMNNSVRFGELWYELHHKYNQAGHKYFWNQRFGKDPKNLSTFGKLWWQQCGKQYVWCQRNNNPSTKCVPAKTSPPTPQWVSDCLADLQMITLPDYFAQEQNPILPSHPSRFRLIGKQPDRRTNNSSEAASSSSLPRTGVG